MTTYLVRRLLAAIPVLFGVATLAFFILHLLPGDPVTIMLAGAPTDPKTVATLRHELGLDQPLIVQYVSFLGHVVVGNFGRSFSTNQPVMQMILSQFPATLLLTLASTAIAVVIGVVLGVLSAIHQNTWIDSLVRIVSLFGVSMPTFWSGVLLILIFAVKLNWFPAAGGSGLAGLVLPASALGFVGAGFIVRMVRNSMLEVISEQYVLTLRSKGLPERVVMYQHALRNALIPAVTMIGVQIGELLAGAVVIETVFARQGLGRLIVTAITSKDFPVVQGAVLFTAIVYVLVNIIVDLSYAFIDPRVQSEI